MEDNEISFCEGDRITNVEEASDDWWQGKDKHGNVGLFPGECFMVLARALYLNSVLMDVLARLY